MSDTGSVHRGRGIGQQHFDLVAGHLVAALGAARVPDPVIEQIASAGTPLAADIVSGSRALEDGARHGDRARQ